MEEILKMENVNLYGIGVNLTCYGAIIPKNENLSQLVAIARDLEAKYGIKLEMVSGGNSSSIYLVDKGELPEGINNLRLGNPSFWETIRPTRQSCREQSVTD